MAVWSNVPAARAIDDRLIVAMRLVLAASALLIIHIDPPQPNRHFVVTSAALILYTAYSAILFALFPRRSSFRLASIAHWVDVAWYVVLISLSSGTNSIFFVFFFFAIMVASFRGGFAPGLRVALVSAALFTIVGFTAAPEGNNFELNRFLLRPLSLLVLGYMIACWGESEIQLKRRLALVIERVMSAQEEERRGIARELHDEAGQSLTSLLVGLRLIEDAQALKKVKAQASRLRHITVQVLDKLRRLSRGLHPSILDDLGIEVALTSHATEYAESHGVTVNVYTKGQDSSRLPSPVEIALYRIVQEALTNIAKHADARAVNVSLERQPWGVKVTVEDDGCGFDVETTLRTSVTSGHLGLYSLCERAALIGGSVTIESKRGKGTTMCVQIPLTDSDPIRMHRDEPNICTQAMEVL